MNIGDKVFVVDWGKHYTDVTRWNNETGKRDNIFPFVTEIPNYSGIDFHWKYIYEPNLTLKGTINKREPEKLVKKIPVYKDYKWEIVEIIKHPQAGQYYWPERKDNKETDRYTTNDILLIASTHTDKDWMKCYVVIEEKGVSKLTPEQYANEQFNGLVEANLGKWNRDTLVKDKFPKELISKFYDSNDDVLFGSNRVKGLVSYSYIDAKFSVDGKPIYLHSSISYDGVGNAGLKNTSLIQSFDYIKKYIEQ